MKLLFFIRFILSFILISSSLESKESQNNTYQLGDGLQISSLPLYIGGYISTDYKNQDSTNTYRIDDIAFLAYGDYKKISYMAEFEFKELSTITDNSQGRRTEMDRSLHTERFYIDYAMNESYTLKLGKYNTPIGYWNLLPVNVLRDTTSSPFTNRFIFPTYSTGLNLSYNSYLGNGNDLSIDFIIQKNEDFDSTYNNYITNEHYGVGITYALDSLSFKIDTGVFHDIRDEREKKYYLLLSSRYENDFLQFTTEIGSQISNKEIITRYAAYTQLSYYISEKNTAILRLEAFDRNKTEKFNMPQMMRDTIAVIGHTYRPLYSIAVKSEYQFHSESKNNKFVFSFSVMF